MAEDRALYLFFKKREEMLAADFTEDYIKEGKIAEAKRWLAQRAREQMSAEGFPLPGNAEPVVVLHSEWVSELEAKESTTAATLIKSIEWYFHERGESRDVTAFIPPQSGHTPLFWIGTYAMLPVWVKAKTDERASRARDDEPRIGSAARAKKANLRQQETAGTAPALERRELEKLTEGDGGSSAWRDVYIFISSTFNDMHAERNYLVKRVFPQLSEWCAAHKLRLRDIDLRWGVTEEDSKENLRTVEICLENIDRCRPFFLCFLGQRRGWVPSDSDISSKTFEMFPKLQKHLGSSVTEMEIIHSMIDPMRRLDLPAEDIMERAFFYFRDSKYLSSIRSESLKAVYTNSADPDPKASDRLHEAFKKKILRSKRPCRNYSCRWDKNAETPELAYIKGATPDIVKGGLTGFACDRRPLCDVILEDLKAAISERYGIAEEIKPLSPLGVELEEQSEFLSAASESFIAHPGDIAPFDKYVVSDSPRPLILTAPAGMGKSSLLAYWIINADYKIYYRFIGGGGGSNTAYDLAYSIWQQLYEDKKTKTPPPQNTSELFSQFGKLLADAAGKHRLVLVIDALDQLPGGVEDASFLPQTLPPNVRLIISVMEEAEGADSYLRGAASYAEMIKVRSLDDAADRNALIKAYLSNYLKELNHDQLESLVSSKGAANPLYLKIVLSELRVLGSHEAIKINVENKFGDTPLTAFEAMLTRLENDTSFSSVPMKPLVSGVFGWISHSRGGLSVKELSEMLVLRGVAKDVTEAMDAVYMLFRQLRPFLAEREQRMDFFYESFREACVRRYTKERSDRQWHNDIAEYFGGKEPDYPHRLLENAWQLYQAGRTEDYLDYVFDYRYLRAKLERFGVMALISDYSLHSSDDTSRMISFLWLAGSVLADHNDQLVPRLYGHFGDSAPGRIGRLISEAGKHNGARFLKPLIPCFEQPKAILDRIMIAEKETSCGPVLLRNDTLAAVVEDEERIVIREIASGSVKRKLPASDEGRIVHIAAAAQGKKLVVCEKNKRDHDLPGEITVYDTFGFSRVISFPVMCSGVSYKYFGNYYRFLGFAIAGDTLLLKDGDRLMRAYDLNTGEPVAQRDLRWSVSAFDISDSGAVVIGNVHPQNDNPDFDKTGFSRISNPVGVFRLDRKSGTLSPVGEPFGEWKNTVWSVALSPDGKYAAGSDFFASYVYRTDTGELISKLEHDPIRTFCFLRKKKMLIAAGESFILYSTEEFRIVREITGLGRCYGVAVSEDESFAVLRTDKDRLRVISLADIEKSSGTVGAPYPIRSVCLSAGGKYVYASCYDNWVDFGKQLVPGKGDTSRLYVIDRKSGENLKQMRLCGRFNRDYTYLAPDGTAVVGRDFNDPECFSVRYWELPAEPLSGDGDLYATSQYNVKLHKHRFSEEYFSSDLQLSSDRKYYIIAEQSDSCTVYRARTGRYMGKVTLREPVIKAKKSRKDEYDSSDMMTGAYYEIAEDGRTLFAFFSNSSMPRIEKYNIHDDILEFSHPITGIDFDAFSRFTEQINTLCLLTDNGSKLAFVNNDTAMLISVKDGKLLFSLDKEKEGIWAGDNFAVCSSDGKMLALTGRNNDEANWLLRLYDTESRAMLAEFFADGTISEICFEEDDRTMLFGMGSGRICRLRLTE